MSHGVAPTREAGDKVEDEHRPEREADHSSGGEGADAERAVSDGRAARDCHPDWMQGRRSHPAHDQEHEDEKKDGRNADQAQEQRRHEDADRSNQPESEVLRQCAEERLGHRRREPVGGDDQGKHRQDASKRVCKVGSRAPRIAVIASFAV